MPAAKIDRKPGWRRRVLIGTLGVLALGAALLFGVPWVRLTLATETTDDAYVNDHVTFVAPRVGGQVSRVLVDDHNRVHKGDVLVEFDKGPYRDAVAVKQAAVTTAEAMVLLMRRSVAEKGALVGGG